MVAREQSCATSSARRSVAERRLRGGGAGPRGGGAGRDRGSARVGRRCGGVIGPNGREARARARRRAPDRALVGRGRETAPRFATCWPPTSRGNFGPDPHKVPRARVLEASTPDSTRRFGPRGTVWFDPHKDHAPDPCYAWWSATEAGSKGTRFRSYRTMRVVEWVGACKQSHDCARSSDSPRAVWAARGSRPEKSELARPHELPQWCNGSRRVAY